MGRSLSLHGKFMLVLVLTSATVALLVALTGYQFAYHRAMDNSRAALQSLADSVEHTVAVALYANDQVLMQELLGGIGKHPLVTAVNVLDVQGGSPTGARESASAARARSGEDAVDRALFSPFDKHEGIGRLRIVVNTAALQAEARREAAVMGLSMVALTVILALVLSFLTLRTFTRPLQALAQELHRMEPGTDRRIILPATHESDELGTVARAANRMLQANQEAINRERDARQEVAAMEARYRQIFDFTSAGIFVTSLDGHLLSSNPTVARLLGTSPQELAATLGDDFVERVFLNAARARSIIDAAARSGSTSSGDLAVRCTDGTIRWVHCLFSVHVENEPDREHFVEGVMYDVTQRKREEQAVKQTIHVDTLTGVKNRAGINAALDDAVAAARQAGGQVCVFYIDLDGFKGINDHWGHAAGDTVLVESARRLKALTRQRSDFVGRLGGDEFLVAVRDWGASEAGLPELALRIVTALSLPISIGGGQNVQVGASVGAAVLPSHANTATDLVLAADHAMYEAKRAGKGRYAFATSIEPA